MIIQLPPEYIKSLFDGVNEINPDISNTKETFNNNNVTRVKLGVDYLPVTKEAADLLKMTKAVGVLVISVKPLSAAENAGIRQGDVILSINGKAVPQTYTGLQESISQIKKDDKINFVILRNGTNKEIKVQF